MIIKSVKGLKFKDEFGIYEHTGSKMLALYEEGKGFISLDGGKSIYIPQSGRKALKSLLEVGIIADINYINSIN